MINYDALTDKLISHGFPSDVSIHLWGNIDSEGNDRGDGLVNVQLEFNECTKVYHGLKESLLKSPKNFATEILVRVVKDSNSLNTFPKTLDELKALGFPEDVAIKERFSIFREEEYYTYEVTSKEFGELCTVCTGPYKNEDYRLASEVVKKVMEDKVFRPVLTPKIETNSDSRPF